MEDKKRKIDLLFEKNVSKQLTDVDWEGLNAAISNRLDQADQRKTSAIGYPTVFKIAAGFVVAAAVIFIAVMIRTDRPTDVQVGNGGTVVVKLIEAKGSASVEVKCGVAKSQVTVDIGSNGGKVAKCDLEIIDLNGNLEKDGEQAAWIIISRPEPVFVDNGADKDEKDFICLW